MPRIHIDTRALTYPWFWLPEHLPRFVDGSVPGGVQLDLPAGEYAVQQTRDRASDLRFRVTPHDTVDFAPGVDHLLCGRGTSTLHVLGVPVVLDPRQTGCPLLPMWGGCREPIGPRAATVRMPPGQAYTLRIGLVPSDVLEFSVRPDGVVRSRRTGVRARAVGPRDFPPHRRPRQRLTQRAEPFLNLWPHLSNGLRAALIPGHARWW